MLGLEIWVYPSILGSVAALMILLSDSFEDILLSSTLCAILAMMFIVGGVGTFLMAEQYGAIGNVTGTILLEYNRAFFIMLSMSYFARCLLFIIILICQEFSIAYEVSVIAIIMGAIMILIDLVLGLAISIVFLIVSKNNGMIAVGAILLLIGTIFSIILQVIGLIILYHTTIEMAKKKTENITEKTIIIEV